MKQTENYQLNQWELTDRIRMEDFNGDNSKLDAALNSQAEALAAETAARAGGDLYVKLLEVTTNAAATQVDLDVSGIDFTAYQSVELHAEFPDQNWSLKLGIQVNDVTDNVYTLYPISGGGSGYSLSNHLAAIGTHFPGMVRFLCGPAERNVTCLSIGAAESNYWGSMGVVGCKWSELTKLTLLAVNTGSNSIDAGARFWMTGLKK